jgi:Uncharacterized conserved protein (DUF2190)
MSSAAVIRDAVYDRLTRSGHGYAKTRKTPMPHLQTDQLPALSIFVLAGRAGSDGDENVGKVHFVWDDTIAISVARGFEDTAVLEGTIAAEVDALLNTLLTDASFVRFPAAWPKPAAEVWAVGDPIYFDPATKNATKVAAGHLRMGEALQAAANPSKTGKVGGLFEGITGATRRWVFPTEGETYFAELRLELTFRHRADYPPVIADDFKTFHVETAFPPGGTAEQQAGELQVERTWDVSE